MEMHDLVDENDCVTGKTSKKEIVKKRLLHRAVHVFIFNKHGMLALQKRSKHLPIGPSLLTSSAAGTVRSQESYDAAANRELKEEIGITTKLQVISKFRSNAGTTNVIGQLYIGKYDGKFRLDPDEVESLTFFDLDSIKIALRNNPAIFSENFKNAFREYLKHTE